MGSGVFTADLESHRSPCFREFDPVTNEVREHLTHTQGIAYEC